MMIQNIYLSNESYAPEDWHFPNLSSFFSRLYYIIDGEGYYEENGKAIRLQKNHLYLTPVNQRFGLSHNPADPLLHTYAHIVIYPPVHALVDIAVLPDTPLADAVALWRKHIKDPNQALQISTAQFVLSCIESSCAKQESLTTAEQIKQYIDALGTKPFHMKDLCCALGYTREHLTRLFSATYHCTPRQYFHTRRMELALKNLQSGSSIKALAFDLGFSSEHAFSKAFRNHFHLPPQQFLHALSEKDCVSARLELRRLL